MSFGFSVGDFVALSTVAYNIYGSLKDSPAEFKSITSEANTLSAILKNIASHLSDHNVDPDSAEELGSLHRQTSKVLEDIRELLERFGSLAKKKPRKFDRIKWALKGSSAELRNKLLFHAGVLNYLNTSLTKLSQDRLEKHINMLLKRAPDGAAMPAHNSVIEGAAEKPPKLHHQLPLREQRSTKTRPRNTSVRVPTCEESVVFLDEPDTPVSQSESGEDAGLLPKNLSDLQNNIPATAERKANTPEYQRPLTHSGSVYQRMKASGKSIQVNGNIGKAGTWPCRSNTYSDISVSDNSMQFNGDILDPAPFFNAVEC